MAQRELPRSYDWTTVILLPILGAVIIGILYTTTLTSELPYKIIAYILSLLVVIVFIYGAVVSAAVPGPSAKTYIPADIKATQDPFIYDPGETANGVVSFLGNGAGLPDQYNCNLKSTHTIYEDNRCNCKTGYYGSQCEYDGFDETYVSLTTNSAYTATPLPSQTAPTLSSWPTLSSVSGCTNICTSNPQCVGVTYANTTCTMYSSLIFPEAPIQNVDLDPPILDTTLYLNKTRLLAIDFRGYFNIVFGQLPVRYFIGNIIASGTSANVHVTLSGTRIGYYPMSIQSSFSGIPDYIIVGTAGILYISPLQIPPPSSINPAGQPTLVALTTPLFLTKDLFPYTDSGVAYYVRLDPPLPAP